MTVTLTLSILDQTIIQSGETSTQAFQHTIQLVKIAEKLGYHRFWVSEHHDLDNVVGSSPEVLISHLLAHTTRIRLGSGGVMLQHYSPYKVAESFHVLASLAPGRVDLGIGRAPGGLPLSTRALQQEGGSTRSLEEKLVELEKFLHNNLEPEHPLYGLKAIPNPSQPADLYLLGTSVASAELAAQRGVPYVFAQFINSDEAVSLEAITTYRERFVPRAITTPQAILALSVIVSDTDENARKLANENEFVKINLASGKTITVNSLKKAEEYGKHTSEPYTIEVKEPNIIAGSKETVRKRLLEIQQTYQVEEVVIITPVKDFQKRVTSYELLAEAFSEQPVTNHL